jgi:hypothetical protein
MVLLIKVLSHQFCVISNSLFFFFFFLSHSVVVFIIFWNKGKSDRNSNRVLDA